MQAAEEDGPTQSRSRRRTILWLLAAVLALGAFLRLNHLGTTALWIDEITFVTDSQPDGSFLQTWASLWRSYPTFHRSPLPVLLEMAFAKGVARLGFRLDEVIYRLPAAVMGIASIGIMYLLARRLFGDHAGLIAAFLLSISFFHIYYSREAYMYSPYLFCAMISWYFLASCLTDFWNEKRIRTADTIGYGISTALTLQMHMASVFFVAAQSLVLLIAPFGRPLSRGTVWDHCRKLVTVVCAHAVAWLTFVPFLWITLVRYRSDDEKLKQNVSALSFLRLLGEMGWSSQLAPWILLLGLLAAGVWLALRNSSSRRAAALCLCLSGIAVVGVAAASGHARCETRYFILGLPALLLFVAVAWVRLSELVTRRASARWRWAVWIVPCVALLCWNVPFYQQLYQLQGKLLAGRALAGWFNHNTPSGSVYFMDYPWALVDVPSMYETPGRIAMAVPAVIYDAYGDPRRVEHILAFTRDVLRRFPDFYYVVTQHLHSSDPSTDPAIWCKSAFRHHTRIENPALWRLVEMKIFPSVAFFPGMRGELKTGDVVEAYLPTDVYYNTAEDLCDIGRAADKRALALFGEGWMCCKLNDGTIWRGLQKEGQVSLYGLRDPSSEVTVTLSVGNFGPAQQLFVAVDGKERMFELPGKMLSRLSVDGVLLRPGVTRVTVRRASPQPENQFPDLLAYEITTP